MSTKKTVDVHVHVFPDALNRLPSSVHSKLEPVRSKVRGLVKPLTSSLHKTQTVMRHLPEFLRRNLDELSGLVPLPGLLVESTPADLKTAMDDASLDYAMVIAHPPYASNEFVLEVCGDDPRLIPVVNVPAGTPKPGGALKRYAAHGARALKIHPSSDGEGPDSTRYRALLKAAAELGLPVILHTGCVHSRLLYKDPEQGRAERYAPWFEKFSQTQFILAHMNFHEPQVALDLVEEYGNVHVDTSWQPAEVIGEAVRRVGADRVLFGSDWPLVGDNMRVGLDRIRDCVDSGLLNETQADLILGGNAVKLLGLSDAG